MVAGLVANLVVHSQPLVTQTTCIFQTQHWTNCHMHGLQYHVTITDTFIMCIISASHAKMYCIELQN